MNMSRAGRLLAAFLTLVPVSAFAQAPQTPPTQAPAQAPAQPAQQAPAPEITFLSHYSFHLSADSIRSGNEPQFAWIANFGGDIDMLNYGKGRVNFLANYEMIAGRHQHVDPNQGNYTLDLSSSWRFGEFEVEALFHHVSRHLIGQVQEHRVAWNSLGARVVSNYTVGPLTVRGNLRVAKVIEAAYVDYRWEVFGGGRADYRFKRYIGVLGSADFGFVGVDPAKHNRTNQVGARVEAGVRVNGSDAAAEMFVAFDRRIDVDPTDLQPRNWVLIGFRLLTR
jgi:hypothetical protein